MDLDPSESADGIENEQRGRIAQYFSDGGNVGDHASRAGVVDHQHRPIVGGLHAARDFGGVDGAAPFDVHNVDLRAQRFGDQRKALAELVSDLEVFPQKIQNVRVREKVPFAQVPTIQAAIRSAEKELNGNGRVVVRYSGTEALARVMVEAESEAKMESICAAIAGEIQKALGV